MSKLTNTRIIKVDSLKRHQSEHEALKEAGFIDVGVFTAPAHQTNPARNYRIYKDHTGLMYAYISSDQKGYSITKITLRRFTGDISSLDK